MATAVGSLSLSGHARPGAGAGIQAGDLRAASWLVVGVLAYGAVMKLLSGAPAAELGIHIADYMELSAYVGILFLCAVVPISIILPSVRQDLRAKLFWLAVTCVLTSLIFPFFAMFKELVLPERGFLWDRTFAHLGRVMFGVSPWTITHRIFGTVAGTRLLDLVYRSWLVCMFALPGASAFLFNDSRLRCRIIACWLFSFLLIGTAAAWLLASAGPCFFNAFVGHDPDYAELLRRLAAIGRQAAAEGHAIAVLRYQPGLVETFRARDFAPGGGISAMPSMHVAMATLFVIVGFRINRWVGALFTVYGLLVWIATVHFGWHYIVDGPVAAAMMAATWWASNFFAASMYRASEVSGELAQQAPV